MNETFYDTIIASKEWQDWEKVAEERGFDYAESKECGWLSPEHWRAFVDFIKQLKDE